MNTPRIALLSEADAKAAAVAGEVPEIVTVLNVNRLLLRHPTGGRNFIRYFWDLIYEGVLEPRLRELAIMRVAWLTDSVYEWTQHWHIALGAGVPGDDLVAVRDWESESRFSDTDRAVLAATDDVVRNGVVTGESWAALEAALPDAAERIEIVLAITGWRMVASILETLDVPLEDGFEPWPPDGVGPRP